MGYSRQEDEYDGMEMTEYQGDGRVSRRHSEDRGDAYNPAIDGIPFVPVLKWSLSVRDMIPNMRGHACDRARSLSGGFGNDYQTDRLHRKELWNKYGMSMHFLTLEFEEPEVETAYAEDYHRRNKRHVEYATLSTGMLLFVLLVGSWYYVGHYDEAFATLCPILIMKYWLFIFFRKHFYLHFQSFLLIFALIEATVLCTVIAFRVPANLLFYQRSSDSYLAYNADHMPVIMTQNTQNTVLAFFVILLATYRLRCAYLMMAYTYTIVLLCVFLANWSNASDCDTDPVSFFPQPRGISPTRYLCDAGTLSRCIRELWTEDQISAFPIGTVSDVTGSAVFLVFLSYSLEMLQRKDFVQATMVFKETHINDLLLHNILPKHIIDRIQRLEKKKLVDQQLTAGWNYHREMKESLADPYSNVTMLFADIVAFTSMSAAISPEKVVALLNNLFHVIDGLAATNGVEKIKTIGDCYMAATGLPVPNPEHAHAMGRFALGLIDKTKEFKNPLTNEPLEIRVGMHSGDCVAGVVGYTGLCHGRIAFDVWGDAVNTASRMESHGAPGKVHCSVATKELIEDDFHWDSLGEMEVKGKGSMYTYFITGEKAQAKSRSYVVCAPGALRLQELQTVLEHVMSETRNLKPMEAHQRIAEINEAILRFYDQIQRRKNKREHYSRLTQRLKFDPNGCRRDSGHRFSQPHRPTLEGRLFPAHTVGPGEHDMLDSFPSDSSDRVRRAYSVDTDRRASPRDGGEMHGEGMDRSQDFIWQPTRRLLADYDMPRPNADDRRRASAHDSRMSRVGLASDVEEGVGSDSPVYARVASPDEENGNVRPRRTTRKIVRFEKPTESHSP
eukprot:GEMP01011821.1.p1 GENE.GEMP01011821.1~~GEMP01011821.1.p1  ORF type:complete len:841 (+),score=149.18 GEMP01011821.1:162-2684(+)